MIRVHIVLLLTDYDRNKRYCQFFISLFVPFQYFIVIPLFTFLYLELYLFYLSIVNNIKTFLQELNQ